MVRKILILIFILTLPGISHLRSCDSNNIGWYIEKFGRYKQGEGEVDHLVERATAVFQRIKKVAEIGDSPPSRLFFISIAHDVKPPPETNENNQKFLRGVQGGSFLQKAPPWPPEAKRKAVALALPDGSIIISPKTLEICYEGVKLDEGDQRIAFILGHELAHLANRDFGRYKTWQALKEMGDKKDRQELFQFFETSSSYEKGNELEADKKGALFAAMAGYKISPLLGEKNNFLYFWVQKVGEDHSYPAVEKRVKSVRIQLQAVKEEVKLFRAGILFLQMGKYTDGAAAFREFSNSYPAREVFNNIGACHLNLALDHLFREFGEEYFRFRLSTAIDYATAPGEFKFRGEGDYLKNRDIPLNLNSAEEYFELAAKRDPHDRACRYNLSALLILKREYAAALAKCNHILKKDPGDVKALNNKATALYYLGKEERLDSSQKAFNFLWKAHLLESSNFETIYNLAALENERGREDKSKFYREKYLKLSFTPRDNYYSYIYEKVNKKKPPLASMRALPPVAPVKIGSEYNIKNSRKYKLTSEKSKDKDSWTINLAVGVKDNLFVLAIEGYNVLVEQELIRPKDPVKLLEKFGPPRKIIHHTAGTFYIYEEKGFSLKEVDDMICSYIWFKIK